MTGKEKKEEQTDLSLYLTIIEKEPHLSIKYGE